MRTLIALDPNDPHAYGVRGLIRREAGRYEDAEADCTQAIQLGLEHPEADPACAVREVRGRPDEARPIVTLRCASPEHPGAYNSRALIRKRLGRSVERWPTSARPWCLLPNGPCRRPIAAWPTWKPAGMTAL